ncbi:DNA ligase 1 [Dendroctonus ponderosae]|uniref:DNA ligase 1-like n=1 Tax=Dendroctonus ponderosae TaxID=77166 RepID=UPI0020363ED6|nr:DNA ligase 1-like [Dendroctonus ponderosae]XP_048523932.1 DNA ligase 1 [Dendroctonus ponderosae]
MPAGNTAKASNPSGRTTFRPPWVKEGSEVTDALNPFNLKSVARKRESPPSDSGDGNGNPIANVQLRKVATKEPKEVKEDDYEITIPDKESPLDGIQLRRVKKKDSERESFRKEKENNPLAGVKLRKTSVQTKEPQQNGEEKDSFFVKPQLKPVPQREKSPPKKDHKIHDLPKLNKVEERKLSDRKPSLLRRDSTIEDLEIDRELPAKRNSVVRAESVRKLSLHGPAPPPMPPPPPGMPGETPKKLLTDKQSKKLELLKSRPKVRPDWSATLKEIEGGRKLKHVECNDRSQPILPEGKAQEHFLYDSEKPNVHNELLKQIETGFKLKKVQTNDRSKPMLEGLRKFRRQMTIEEQIQKSMSMASIPPVSDEIAPEEVDELDDIDKVRDDLQSTKQMLALELRNKEAQEMENKRLLQRIANMEAELEKAKAGGGHTKAASTADDKVIQSLKKEADQSRKNSEQIEKRYTEAMKTLDTTKLQLEDTKRKNAELEKKLLDALGGKRVSIGSLRQNSVVNGGDDDEMADDETEEESDGEDTPEKREKRLQKEVKQLGNKLRNFKNKEDNAKKERIALKEIIKKNQLAIKEEKKRYNKIKKEVDKMAALLKDVSEDEDEDEEEKDDDEETEEEEESSDEETETESDTDESDSEKSLSEPEDAPLEKKKTNLASRSKRHESRLGALKKGNFLLKTNAERLQDDLNKQKEMTAGLQEDLDSVLSELG